MAGAEAAVQSFFLEKPELPKRLRAGTKFLKWPKADGEVGVVNIQAFKDFDWFCNKLSLL